jgi:hypothetical protein
LKLTLRGKEIDELGTMLGEPWLPKIDQIALELYFEDCSIGKFRAFHDMIDSHGYVLVWKEIIWQDQTMFYQRLDQQGLLQGYLFMIFIKKPQLLK